MWLGLTFGVPLAQWLTGFVWHPIYLERTMLFSVLLLLVPVASWLDRHATRLMSGFGIMVVLLGLLGVYTNDRNSFEAHQQYTLMTFHQAEFDR